MAAVQPSPLSLTEMLSHCTVRIETNTGMGTGFFYRFGLKPDGWHIPAIVTNKHVVEGATSGRFLITRGLPDGRPDMTHHETYSFDNFEAMWLHHPSVDVDLCAMPTAPILTRAQQGNVRLFYAPLDPSLIPTDQEFDELNPVEDITMVGYPNGLWDQVHNMPIFRRGITATHSKLNWNGRPEFLIDAACFPGSSGSPVFLLNEGGYRTRQGMMLGATRIKLLGVLYAGPQHTVEGQIAIVAIPTQNKPVAISAIPNNLGMVIRSTALKQIESEFIQRAKANNEI